jgi:hypothetical protein
MCVIMWIRYAGTWSDKTKEQEEKKRMMSAASNKVQSSPNIFGDLSFLRRPSEWTKSAWVIFTLWILLIGTAIYLQTWRTTATLCNKSFASWPYSGPWCTIIWRYCVYDLSHGALKQKQILIDCILMALSKDTRNSLLEWRGQICYFNCFNSCNVNID